MIGEVRFRSRGFFIARTNEEKMSESNNRTIPPLPYLNADFLKSREARVIRILSEYLEPHTRLRQQRIRDTIVFFGSARSLPPEQARAKFEAIQSEIEQAGTTPELEAARQRSEQAVKLARYYEDAMELARRITEWSKGLTGNHHFIICSGGSGGMMEAANRGASMARGKTIGFNIHLPLEQEVNQYVSRELIFNFHYFFMRKFWFVYPAKALVVFPGGFGTMDELFEVLTLDSDQDASQDNAGYSVRQGVLGRRAEFRRASSVGSRQRAGLEDISQDGFGR